jgi:hypothetical protein
MQLSIMHDGCVEKSKTVYNYTVSNSGNGVIGLSMQAL